MGEVSFQVMAAVAGWGFGCPVQQEARKSRCDGLAEADGADKFVRSEAVANELCAGKEGGLPVLAKKLQKFLRVYKRELGGLGGFERHLVGLARQARIQRQYLSGACNPDDQRFAIRVGNSEFRPAMAKNVNPTTCLSLDKDGGGSRETDYVPDAIEIVPRFVR